MDKQEWSKIIKECKADFDNLETNKERIKRNLKGILASVIEKNTDCCGIYFTESNYDFTNLGIKLS